MSVQRQFGTEGQSSLTEQQRLRIVLELPSVSNPTSRIPKGAESPTQGRRGKAAESSLSGAPSPGSTIGAPAATRREAQPPPPRGKEEPRGGRRAAPLSTAAPGEASAPAEGSPPPAGAGRGLRAGGQPGSALPCPPPPGGKRDGTWRAPLAPASPPFPAPPRMRGRRHRGRIPPPSPFCRGYWCNKIIPAPHGKCRAPLEALPAGGPRRLAPGRAPAAGQRGGAAPLPYAPLAVSLRQAQRGLLCGAFGRR